MKFEERNLEVYGRSYRVRVRQSRYESPSAPRLVVVGFQPNESACAILRLCLDSIRGHTPEPHELWVVDNCSPPHLAEWLAEEHDINIIFNHTRPHPARPFRHWFNPIWVPPYAGSYANAVALELAAKVIDPATEIMMTLHMDTLACKVGWLSYLRGKLNDQVRCVGVRLDSTRVKTVHVLGMLFDFTLFTPLELTFAPAMPVYDTGDAISIRLREAGYRLWACRNTLHQPDLVDLLATGSPFREVQVDRSLDDHNEVVFMHLGRGIIKSEGQTTSQLSSPEAWLSFGNRLLGKVSAKNEA